MSFKSILTILRSVTVLTFVALSVTGSDCDKVTADNNYIPQQLIGNWLLTEQTGALQDVCPDEYAGFQSNGIALLTCPASDTISRNFKVENSELTYIQTSVRYRLEFSDDNSEVWFYGTNVSRNLKYEKIITTGNISSKKKNTGYVNSSEKR